MALTSEQYLATVQGYVHKDLLARQRGSNMDKIERFLQDVLEIRDPASFKTVFDVGANVGQSTRRYRLAFPDAQIFSFEPVPTTYETLTANLKGDPMVRCENVALSDRTG